MQYVHSIWFFVSAVIKKHTEKAGSAFDNTSILLLL